MNEQQLMAAYSAGPAPEVAVHVPVPHELRRAWQTAKTLAEQLEVADQLVLRRIALYLREELFAELLRVEGFEELEVVPDPA